MSKCRENRRARLKRRKRHGQRLFLRPRAKAEHAKYLRWLTKSRKRFVKQVLQPKFDGLRYPGLPVPHLEWNFGIPAEVVGESADCVYAAFKAALLRSI